MPVTLPGMREIHIEALILDWFRYQRRWIAIKTGDYKSSQRPVNDEGCPDLLLRNPHWPVGVYLAIEVKMPQTGRLSAAQKRLFAEGGMVVCRSLEEAQEAAQRADRLLLGEE